MEGRALHLRSLTKSRPVPAVYIGELFDVFSQALGLVSQFVSVVASIEAIFGLNLSGKFGGGR